MWNEGLGVPIHLSTEHAPVPTNAQGVFVHFLRLHG